MACTHLEAFYGGHTCTPMKALDPPGMDTPEVDTPGHMDSFDTPGKFGHTWKH